MPIIFVDRNVISTCEQILRHPDGKRLNTELDYRKQQLRKINNNKNRISALLSIVEGSKGIDESEAEKEETLKHEALIIKRYFKKAKNDSEFLLDARNEFAKTFSENYIEENAQNYLNFISEMHPLLANTTSVSMKDAKRDKIFDIATKNNVDPSHLVVITALAVLHENIPARKMFKLTNKNDADLIKKRAYNAYNDLFIVSRIGRLQEMFRSSGRDDKIEFFSFDKDLNKFINAFIINSIKIYKNSDGSSTAEFNISLKTLFPNMGIEELEEIAEKAKNASDKFYKLKS